MKTEPNEPINHITEAETDRIKEYPKDAGYKGLTKREHFAAIAMQGLLASNDWTISKADLKHAEATAVFAVLYADTLIAELNK